MLREALWQPKNQRFIDILWDTLYILYYHYLNESVSPHETSAVFLFLSVDWMSLFTLRTLRTFQVDTFYTKIHYKLWQWMLVLILDRMYRV